MVSICTDAHTHLFGSVQPASIRCVGLFVPEEQEVTVKATSVTLPPTLPHHSWTATQCPKNRRQTNLGRDRFLSNTQTKA